MRTRTSRSKSSAKSLRRVSPRSRSSALKRYAPWVAAICATAYLPPQVHGVTWIPDGDGTWSTAANWVGGVAPLTAAVTAEFLTNFSLNRTVTLDVTTAVNLVRLNDVIGQNTLTISGGGQFQLQTSGNTFDVGKDNTLVVGSLIANVGTDTGKLIKTGLGTLQLTNGGNSFTGGIEVQQGLISYSSINNGGANGTLGAASNAPGSILLNGGGLSYVGTGTATTDRLFTVGLSGGSIESNNTGAMIFANTGATAVAGIGQRMLYLGGTGTGANEMRSQLTGTIGLTKTGTGTWRLTNSNNYTGNTVIQRGTLVLDYLGGTPNTSRLPDRGTPTNFGQDNNNNNSTADIDGDETFAERIVMGGGYQTPGDASSVIVGGGVLELSGNSSSNHQENVGHLTIRPGNNIIQHSGGATAALYIPSLTTDPLVHQRGGILRLSTTNGNTSIISTTQDTTIQNRGLIGGWMYYDDDWATMAAVPNGDTSLYRYKVVKFNQNGAIGYSNADLNANNLPSTWTFERNISMNFNQYFPDSAGEVQGIITGSVSINSLRMTNLPGTQPGESYVTKQLVLASGPENILNINTGGLMLTGGQNASLLGGQLTSNTGELFMIVRSGSLLITSTYIGDSFNVGTLNNNIAQGIAKAGGGNLIFENFDDGRTDNDRINFHGDVWINEGNYIMRKNTALGAALSSQDDPGFENIQMDGQTGQTFVNGGNLDFQGVNYFNYDVDYLNNNAFIGISEKQEDVYLLSGAITASQGRSSFMGNVISANKDQRAILNINGWLDLGVNIGDEGDPIIKGTLSGIAGFEKQGTGMLLVNADLITSDNTSTVAGAGDLNLTNGQSVWLGRIQLGDTGSPLRGSVNVTGGQHSIRGNVDVERFQVTGGTLGLGRVDQSQTIAADVLVNGGSLVVGSINQPLNVTQTFSGKTVLTSGTLTSNGNVAFTGPFSTSGGATYTQGSAYLPGLIQTATFSNSNITFGGPVTLNYNTDFNNAVTVSSGQTATLNGVGVTNFNQGLTATGANMNLARANIGTSGSPQNYVVNGGTHSFNALNTVYGQLIINQGTFQQTGTRRGVPGVGDLLNDTAGRAYTVRDTFAGGIVVANNVTSGTNNLSASFNGANTIGNTGANPSIIIRGNPSPLNGTYPYNGAFQFTTEAIFRNANFFTNPASGIALRGGRTILENGNAFGGVGVTIADGGGDSAEKTIFTLQRGTATASGDLTIGVTTGYVSGIVVTSRGTGYSSAPSVTFTGNTGTNAATATAAIAGTSPNQYVNSFSVTNVGAGYTSAPAVTLGGPGTGAAAVAVLGGPVALRSQDQHNIWGGNIILNNVNPTTGQVTGGLPIISVNSDDSLTINGNIYGGSTAVTSVVNGYRTLSTGVVGGANNSANGFIILNGFVQDNVGNTPVTAANQFRMEFVGNQELTVMVNKEWRATGMVTIGQGLMRYTADLTSSNNFFSTNAGQMELSVAPTATSSLGWNAANNQVGFFLTKPSQVLNIQNLLVHNSNIDRLSGAQSSSNSGNIVIGGENESGTVTYGIAATDSRVANNGTGAILVDTDRDDQIRDLRLYANAGGTVDIKANIYKSTTANLGKVSLTKIGDGTVRLLGVTNATASNAAYAGLNLAQILNVMGGTLEIGGFTATNANASFASTGDRVALNTAVTMGGGALRVIGSNSTGAVTQTVNLNGTFTLRQGNSALVAQDGTVAGVTMNVAVNQGLSRNTGSTLRFVETNAAGSGAASTSKIIFKPTDVSASGKFYGWSVYGNSQNISASNAATHFGFVSGTGEVDKYINQDSNASDGTLIASWAANKNINETTEGGAGTFFGQLNGPLTIGSLRFNSTTSGASTVNLGGSTLSITNGILVSSDAGSGLRTISNGLLRQTGSSDLVIHNYGVGDANGDALVISAQLTGSANAFTFSGDGRTILTNNANDFTGNIHISGVLQISHNTQLGNSAPGVTPAKNNSIFLEGGTLRIAADVTTASQINLVGDTSRLWIAPASTLLTTSNFQTERNFLSGYNADTSTNAFNGSLVIDGGGTFYQKREGANPINGKIIITGNSRYLYEGNNGSFLGTNANGSSGSSFSDLDGTYVNAGSTLEIRPTNNFTIGDFLHLAGTGQDNRGALRMERPETGSGAVIDRDISIVGAVTLDNHATVHVKDSAENIGAIAGILSFNDNLFDGNNFTLTKEGNGVLRFVNNQIKELNQIQINEGEVRFESGITGVIGKANNAGAAAIPTALADNYFTGTSLITIGNGAGAGFAQNPRLWLNDVRGVHNVNLTLNNGFLLMNSNDAPLQSVSLAGTITLVGDSSKNAIEVNGGGASRANPTMVFGPIVGLNGGGFTKLGVNELQLFNANNSFTGQMVIARGGYNQATPSVGLYDAAALTGVSSIRITNDGTLYLNNQDGFDNNTGNNQQQNRINDTAQLILEDSARIRLLGAHSATPTVETVGDVLLRRGNAVIELDPGINVTGPATFNSRGIGLNIGNLDREAGGTLQLRVLESGVTFGTSAAGNNQAAVKVGAVAPSMITGGGGGGFNATNRNIVQGVYSGVATQAYASLVGSSVTNQPLVNTEQVYIARHFTTLETTGNGTFLRPLTDSEYFNPGLTDGVADPTLLHQSDAAIISGNLTTNRATNYFAFDSNYTATTDNVRLIGGFGPYSSAVAVSEYAQQGVLELDNTDNSRRRDSLYRVLTNTTFNSLSMAPTASEFLNGAGNRVILEIDPNATLNITSGMILHAGLGVLDDLDPVGDNMDQRAWIRGGTINFGNKEILLHNVAGFFRETSGQWSGTNGDLFIYSTLAGSNGLTKTGTSLVALGGKNTYSGITNVSEGPLRLEHAEGLGNSQEVWITGNGDFRMRRAIEVGTVGAANNPKIIFRNPGITNQFRNDAEYNIWNGDLVVDNFSSSGDRVFSAQLYVGGASTMVIGGNIYGDNEVYGNYGGIGDVQRNRGSRVMNLLGDGGVLQLRGLFQDNENGVIGSQVDSSNETTVLRGLVSNNNEQNVMVYQNWNSAGALLLRMGIVTLQPEAGNLFYSPLAASRLNGTNGQSRPQLGDAGGGDAALLLGGAGQVFNSSNLVISNGQNDGSYTIGSTTAGNVQFMKNDSSSLNTMANHTNLLDRMLRLYTPEGGTAEVFGRMQESSSGNQGGIAKVGRGTVYLRGVEKTIADWSQGSSINDFDKQIVAGGGLLVLDYATNDIGTLSSGTLANGWGGSNTSLAMAGGALELMGDETYNVTQAYTGLTLRPGSSELIVTAGAGKTFALTINGNTNNAVAGFNQVSNGASGSTSQPTNQPGKNGGTLNFVLNAGASIKYSIPTGTNSTGLAGAGNQMLGVWATMGSLPGQVTDFAFRTTTTDLLVPFTGYTERVNPATFASGDYVSEGAVGFAATPVAAGSGTQVKVIKMAGSAASTLNITGTLTLGNGTAQDEGAILIPTGVSAAKAIAGGSLKVNGDKDLFIHNYGTGGLTVSSTITGANNVVIAGPTNLLLRSTLSGSEVLNSSINEEGVTTFTGNNTYSGKTFLNGGILQVSDVTSGKNLGADPGSAGENLVFSGGTLRFVGSTQNQDPDFPNDAGSAGGSTRYLYTQNGKGTLAANRSITVGGNGAIFDVAGFNYVDGGNQPINGGQVRAEDTLQINGVISSPQNAALQSGSTTGYLVRNPFVGDITKTGVGVLALNNGNSYLGLTQVRQGTLSLVTNNGNVLGTSYGELDGTVISSGATLRLAHQAGGLTTNEWITFEGGSTLEARYVTGNAQSTTFDGVVTLLPGAPIVISYGGDFTETTRTGQTVPTLVPTSIGGNVNITFGNSGGYLRGSGTLHKKTIYHSGLQNGTQGGVLSLNESNPEWTGGLIIDGGRVYVRATGAPTGTGVIPISLGSTGDNDIITVAGPNTTTSGEEKYQEANLWFAPEFASASNGAATNSGIGDTTPSIYRIKQDIVINQPSAGVQTKQIGVTTAAGNYPSSFDEYHFDGDIILNDDVNLYADGNVLNVPTGGSTVNMFFNGSFVEGTDGTPGTIYTRLNMSGRQSGAAPDQYNDFFVNFNLTGNNTDYNGTIVVGNGSTRITGIGYSNFATNQDANHILNLQSNTAMGADFSVFLANDATIRTNGHNITMGSLVYADIQPAVSTTKILPYSIDDVSLESAGFKSGVDPERGTTADMYNDIGPSLNSPGAKVRSIIENASTTASTLTINQTQNGHWGALIRDGAPAVGASGALTIVKTGSGIAQISTANTYTGGTIINGGTIQLESILVSSGSPLGTGAVEVNFNGTLGGNALITNEVTVNQGGKLAPGIVSNNGSREAGLLQFVEGFDPTLNAGAILEFDIYGQDSSSYDQILAEGLNIQGNVALTLVLDRTIYDPVDGDPLLLDGHRFTIIDTSGVDPLDFSNGTFTYNGSVVGINGDINYRFADNTTQIFRIVLEDSGRDVALVAVPEPGSAISLVAGMGMLLGLQRFRRRRPVGA